MKVADLVLEDMVERAEREELASASGERLRAHLEHMAEKARELHGLFIHDTRGKWVATSLGRGHEGNNSDREYFSYDQHTPGRLTHIGPPIRSRSTGFGLCQYPAESNMRTVVSLALRWTPCALTFSRARTANWT